MDPSAASPGDPPAAHEGAITLGAACNEGAGAPQPVLHASFVRYPGCQQLKVWLPQPGRLGYAELRVRCVDGPLLVAAPVSQCLHGEVQLLFDTLHWPPGALRLEIDHADGWRHVLPLNKSHDGTPPVLPQPAAQADAGEDLQLRARALRALADSLAAQARQDSDPGHHDR